MSDIFYIKSCLSTNKRISFFVPDLYVFIKFEKVLIQNDYRWRSREFKTSILTTDKNNISMGNICLSINYRGDEPKVLSYDIGYQPHYCDVVLSHENINDMIIKIFNIQPNYKPKDKVKRTIDE